jgi:hypothetical protein
MGGFMGQYSKSAIYGFLFLGFNVLGWMATATIAQTEKTLTIDFNEELRIVRPLTGFLGGLRDATPDSLLKPLNANAWRMGWQYQNHIVGDITQAIDKVSGLGAQYKLVMSDLIGWSPTPEQIQNLVKKVGNRAGTLIWEPDNEPDVNVKPDTAFFKTYVATFKALRAVLPNAQVAGPGYAFPSLEKYRAFLAYCRAHQAEVNILTWHYTGWNPQEPENMHWQLGELRSLISEFPEVKIREIHCDEWGAGPETPGRLEPGRALIWFHYLENVYKLDRAGRANWGGADDYLGGIVDANHKPYPVYHAYRLYGSTLGQTRIATTGGDGTMAALASKSMGRAEILIGSLTSGTQIVNLDLKGAQFQASDFQIKKIPNSKLDSSAPASPLEPVADFRIESILGGTRLILSKVQLNEFYQVMVSNPAIKIISSAIRLQDARPLAYGLRVQLNEESVNFASLLRIFTVTGKLLQAGARYQALQPSQPAAK